VISKRGLACPSSPWGQANARLIADAPDLLAASQGLKFSAYPAHGSGFVVIVQGDIGALQTAIAKATALKETNG
jgi:hypothetical protein